MHRWKKAVLSVLICLICSILCGCAFRLAKTRPFSAEELESYNAPIVFLGSSDGRYFITLDNPDERYNLDFKQIWDSNSADKTFLFSAETEGKEEIYEYDFVKKTSRCILEEDFVCGYLNLSEDSEFESVYYYPDENMISFLYEDILCIYDVDKGKVVYKKPLDLEDWESVYGWLTSQTLLMKTEDIFEIYEVNIYTGEKVKVADDNIMGDHLILTDDKTMGCSVGDEDLFGLNFSPVLVWDTKEYKVKRFGEGTMYVNRVQLSNDNKYVMFVRIHSDEPNQVLCLNVEEETMCEVYETENWIYDILWW